jgi:hypothetical protein
MTTLALQTRLLTLLLALAACPTHATEPAPATKPTVAEQARAIGAQVKQDAQAVGQAVKKEATKIGHAAKEQAIVLKTKVKAQTGKADEPKPIQAEPKPAGPK